MLHYLLGLAGAAAAYRAVLHVLYRDREGVERQRHLVRTPDGATIALHRVLPEAQRYAEPVLFCHGLGANRYNLDYPEGEYSLAGAFARAGHDAWVVELRGSGESLPPLGRGDWDFDDFLQQDLPAAIDHIRHSTGSEKVHWVGHSMGGMLLYAYLLGPRGADVRSGVTLGSPCRFTGAAERFALELRLQGLLRVIPRLHLQAISQWTTPLSGRVQHRFSRGMMNWENVDSALIRRAQYRSISDLSRSLSRQFLRWVSAGSFSCRDGSVCWTEQLPKIQQPVLVVAGGGDALVPVQDVRYAFEAMGEKRAEYFELSRAAGYAHDYGHIDLVFGREAPRLVFPRIVEFVQRHSQAQA